MVFFGKLLKPKAFLQSAYFILEVRTSFALSESAYEWEVRQ